MTNSIFEEVNNSIIWMISSFIIMLNRGEFAESIATMLDALFKVSVVCIFVYFVRVRSNNNFHLPSLLFNFLILAIVSSEASAYNEWRCGLFGCSTYSSFVLGGNSSFSWLIVQRDLTSGLCFNYLSGIFPRDMDMIKLCMRT